MPCYRMPGVDRQRTGMLDVMQNVADEIVRNITALDKKFFNVQYTRESKMLL